MWNCPKCGEKIQVYFDICWKCGTAPDGTEDPEFEAVNESVEECEDFADDDEPRESQTTPILKQYYSLTPQDFDRHPVWVNCHLIDYDEPWFEETDEATYRPWLDATPVDPSEWSFVVRALITFANGTTSKGFVTPAENDNDFGVMQPMIFSQSGEQFSIWQGIAKLSREERERFYAALGLAPADVFPLAFSAEPGLANGFASGTAHGFYRLKNLESLEEVEVFT